MAGIVAYIGKQEAVPLLIQGLKLLEYRGYDSVGIGIVDPDGQLHLRRMVGRMELLKGELARNPLLPKAHLGIGHTRWATHGSPTIENAHPQTNSTGRIAVVQNGTIDNYASIKKELEPRKIKFRSQTDTEVAAELIGETYAKMIQNLTTGVGPDYILSLAVAESVKHLCGVYALAVICTDEPDTLVLSTRGSPLNVYSDHEGHFVSSDREPFEGQPYRRLGNKETLTLHSRR